MNHGNNYKKSESIYRERGSKRSFVDAISDTPDKPKVAFSTSIGSKDDTSGNDFYGAPYFGQTNTEVLVQEGNHAFFHCPVHNIRNQTVTYYQKTLLILLFPLILISFTYSQMNIKILQNCQ